MSDNTVGDTNSSCGFLCQLVFHVSNEDFQAAASVMEEILLSDKVQLYVEAMQKTFCPGVELCEDESLETTERLKQGLGELLSEVLEFGIMACSDKRSCLRALILQPVLILDLHTAIFVDGGFYWTERFNNHPFWKALGEQSKPVIPDQIQ